MSLEANLSLIKIKAESAGKSNEFDGLEANFFSTSLQVKSFESLRTIEVNVEQFFATNSIINQKFELKFSKNSPTLD